MITEELKQIVKETFKNSNFNGKNIHQILKQNNKLKEELQKEFNQKPKIYNSIGKLVILICKDIKLKRCKICGKEMSYDRTIDNKSLFCSNKCKLNGEQNPFKKKEIQEKIKQKCFEKYGVYNPGQSKELRQKKNKTCIQKYGQIHPVVTEEIKNKIKETLKNNYGGSQWNNNELRQKMLRGKYNTTYEKIKEKYKEQNIEPLFTKEQFIGTNHLYKWKCTKCGNEFQSIYHNGIIYSRCFNCHPRKVNYISSYEKEICQFLKQFNIKYEQSNKQLIHPYELDIVIPEKKIAIEFNGNYWHSTQIKDKKYHINKTNKCQEIGYRLIHIFEYDWKNTQTKQILIQKLKAMLNINQQSIYARKCIIDEKIFKQKKDFLNSYHIQGNDKSSISLGLKFNNELIAVMTFNKPRFNNKYDWELVRYATKAGYRVIGGAGKLLSYFRKKYTGTIITYADRKYSNGNMYQKIGFNFLYNTDPNYVWINKNNNSIILNRYQTQKHKLKHLLPNFDPLQSEVQNMKNNGFYQIFDAGNRVYILI